MTRKLALTLLVALVPALAVAARPDGNKRTARRYFEEMWNRLDPGVANQIVAPDVVGHIGGTTVRGRPALDQRIAFIGKLYSKMRFTVDDVIAEGDRVVVRWTQHGTHSGAVLGPATAGKSFTVSGMNAFRFKDGRIAEIWIVSDDLGELEQVGALTRPAGW